MMGHHDTKLLEEVYAKHKKFETGLKSLEVFDKAEKAFLEKNEINPIPEEESVLYDVRSTELPERWKK